MSFRSIFTGEFGPAVMHYFFGEFFGIGGCWARLDEPITDLSISDDNIEIGHPQATALSMILTYLTSLSIEKTSWTVEGVLCLLRAIKRNLTLTKLTFCLPEDAFADNGFLAVAMQETFAVNTTLTELEIQGDVSRSESNDKFINAILKALTQKSSLKTLSLNWLVLSEVRLLARYLSNCQLSSFTMCSVELEGDYDVTWSFQPECQLQSVDINIFPEDRDGPSLDLQLGCYRNLIYQLRDVPFLEELHFEYGSRKSSDFTEQLISATSRGNLRTLCIRNVNKALNSEETFDKILQKNRHLEQIEFTYDTYFDAGGDDNYVFDAKAAVACMARNIEHNNLRLKDVGRFTLRQGGLDKDVMKFEYFRDLNKFGREKASSQNINLAEFVDLLCDSANAVLDPIPSSRYHERFDRKHNLHFGLLRTAPNIWSDGI